MTFFSGYIECLMRKKYIEKMLNEIKKGGGKADTASLSGLAKKIGLSYSQLYRIVNGIRKGTIDSWEKIFLYYSKK